MNNCKDDRRNDHSCRCQYRASTGSRQLADSARLAHTHTHLFGRCSDPTCAADIEGAAGRRCLGRRSQESLGRREGLGDFGMANTSEGEQSCLSQVIMWDLILSGSIQEVRTAYGARAHSDASTQERDALSTPPQKASRHVTKGAPRAVTACGRRGVAQRSAGCGHAFENMEHTRRGRSPEGGATTYSQPSSAVTSAAP